jgi:hypothetical protein
MSERQTTVIVQCYLDDLAKDSPAESVVQPLNADLPSIPGRAAVLVRSGESAARRSLEDLTGPSHRCRQGFSYQRERCTKCSAAARRASSRPSMRGFT